MAYAVVSSPAVPVDVEPSGKPFVKVYMAGFRRLDEALKRPGGALSGRLWAFLSQHADHHNALVISLGLLAEVLDCDERSVRRAAATLAEVGCLVIAKIGTTNCYILNPNDLWRSFERDKRFCGFTAKAIVGFKENPGLRARVKHVFAVPDDEASSVDVA